MADDTPDSPPITCQTIRGPVIQQKERPETSVTCGKFTGRNPDIRFHNLEFENEDPYQFYNAVSYAFSKRNFAPLRVNARKFYGPRSLDRCVLEALSGCLRRQQDQRCRVGRDGSDELKSARSKAKRQNRFMGLGRRDPFEAVENFETIHQPEVTCSGEVLEEPDASVIPRDLYISEFRVALLDSMVGAFVRERWDGLDVDGAFEKFSQEYLRGDRKVTRRRNFCGGAGRHRRPATLRPKFTDGALEEEGSTAPTLPRLYRGRLITVSTPGRAVNWKVRYWDVNALDKIAASGRK